MPIRIILNVPKWCHFGRNPAANADRKGSWLSTAPWVQGYPIPSWAWLRTCLRAWSKPPDPQRVTAGSPPAFPTSDLSELNGLTNGGKTNRSNQRFPNLTSGNRMKIGDRWASFSNGSYGNFHGWFMMFMGFAKWKSMETTEVATGMLPSLTGGPHKSSNHLKFISNPLKSCRNLQKLWQKRKKPPYFNTQSPSLFPFPNPQLLGRDTPRAPRELDFRNSLISHGIDWKSQADGHQWWPMWILNDLKLGCII